MRSARALKSKLIVIGVAVSLGVAILAACGFPDVSFTEATGSEGGGPDGNNDPDGRVGDGAVNNEAGDAAVLEAAVRDDATARIPDGSCLSTDCDCDHDFYYRSGCDAGVPNMKKVDCDDLDPLRHPEAGLTEEQPDPGQQPSGDWNCDGVVTKAYPANVKCAYALTTCTGGSGFQSDPACGVVADYIECHDYGVLSGGCKALKIDSRPQLCQ